EAVVVAGALRRFGDHPDLFQRLQVDAVLDGALDEPVAQFKRREADAELADGRAEEFALAEIATRHVGQLRIEEALLIRVGGPAHHLEEVRPRLAAGDGGGAVVELDAGLAGQHLQRLAEADLLAFLNKAYDVAVFTTGPAAVALVARVHVERRMGVVVERTEALVGRPGGAQRDVAAY